MVSGVDRQRYGQLLLADLGPHGLSPSSGPEVKRAPTRTTVSSCWSAGTSGQTKERKRGSTQPCQHLPEFSQASGSLPLSEEAEKRSSVLASRAHGKQVAQSSGLSAALKSVTSSLRPNNRNLVPPKQEPGGINRKPLANDKLRLKSYVVVYTMKSSKHKKCRPQTCLCISPQRRWRSLKMRTA